MSEANPSYDRYFSCRRPAPNAPVTWEVSGYLRPELPDKDIRILDIGCGLGEHLRGFIREGFTRVQGVDISPDAVEHCRGTGLDVERINRIQDCVAGPFDLVTIRHVLEHLPKDEIIPTLAHIRTRLLAPGGRLLVCVPNAQSNTGCYWAYEDFTHHTLFTAGSLLYVLESAGFQDLRFLDPDGLHGLRGFKRQKRRFWLAVYKQNLHFWNKVTSSSFHAPSPQIFTYELKCLARV